MSDYNDEERGRLELMADERQSKWDLSPNDQAAIRAALSEIDELAARVRELESPLEKIKTIINAHFYGDDGELTRGQSAKIALESIRTLLGESR